MFFPLLLAITIALTVPSTYAAPATTSSPPTGEFIHTVICPDGFNNYRVCRAGEGCSVTCRETGDGSVPTTDDTPLPTKPPKSVVDFLANGTFDTKAQTITFNIN